MKAGAEPQLGYLANRTAETRLILSTWVENWTMNQIGKPKLSFANQAQGTGEYWNDCWLYTRNFNEGEMSRITHTTSVMDRDTALTPLHHPQQSRLSLPHFIANSENDDVSPFSPIPTELLEALEPRCVNVSNSHAGASRRGSDIIGELLVKEDFKLTPQTDSEVATTRALLEKHWQGGGGPPPAPSS